MISGLFDLTGCYAAVTGASRGIGRDAALALASAGANLTLVARDSADLASAAVEAGDGGEAVPLDMNDLTAVSAFFASRDPFDIVVNCAETNWPKLLDEVSIDD